MSRRPLCRYMPVGSSRKGRRQRHRAAVAAHTRAQQRARAAGCTTIIEAIESVGPCSGAWATNAFPGNSWHQWGLAEDDYWLVDGEAIWSSRKLVNGLNGYKVWSEEAAKHGLRSLGAMGDWPHVQGPAESSPSRLYSLAQIDAAMRKRFGG